MIRNPVSSTSIQSIGYEPETSTLEIEFQSGEVYDYFDVPLQIYADFMKSDSHGQFFLRNIRDQYAYRKVTA